MEKEKSENKLRFTGAINSKGETVCAYDIVRWHDSNYVLSIKVEVAAHKKGLAKRIVYKCYPFLAEAADGIISLIDEKFIEEKR